MRIIKIEESKVDEMYDLAKQMAKSGKKLMKCIDELEEGAMGERDDDDDWDDDDDMGMRDGYRNGGGGGMRRREGGGMGMRRSSRTGRYIR